MSLFTRLRQSRRRIAVILVATLGALALSSCASDGSSGGGAAEDGPVDLRAALWSSNEAQHAVFNEIADDFIAENPDLVKSVTFDAYPLDQYPQALVTQVSGGEAPDLAWALQSNAREYIDQGVLMDVSDALSSDPDYDMGDIVDGSLDVWSDGDAVYAYPFSSQPFGIYVNLDLLEKSGQPNPRDLIASGDWTWGNVMEMADASADATGQGGLQIQSWSVWVELATIWDSFGAEPWTSDGSKAEFDSPQMREFFNWVNDNMFDRNAIVRPGETYDFTAGTAAFKIHLLSSSGGLDGSFKWDYVPLPSGKEGQVSVLNQAGIGVLQQSAHPEIAAKFLAFFTNKTNAAKLSTFFPQPRESLLTVDALAAAAPQMTKEQIEGTIIEPLKDAVPLPAHPNYGSFADEVASSLELISQKEADVDSILEQLQASVSSYFG